MLTDEERTTFQKLNADYVARRRTELGD